MSRNRPPSRKPRGAAARQRKPAIPTPGHQDPAPLLAKAAAHLQAGQLEAAAAVYRTLLAAAPGNIEARFNLALALQQLGRPGEAEEHYRAVLDQLPGSVEALSNLALALQDLGRLDEAAATFRRAIVLRPDYAEAHCNLGNLLRETGQAEDAVASHRAALALRPDLAEAHSNLGVALQDLGRPEEAEGCFRTAIALRPAYAAAHYNLGNVLQARERLDEAETSFRTAVALAPGHAEAHHNLGLILLGAGKFQEGWREHEWRWRAKGFQGERRPGADRPAWRKETGPAEAGRGGTVLLWAEQGLGDTIQFARYVPEVVRTGWRVLLDVPPALTGLFAGMEGVTMVPAGAPLPPFDAQCSLLDLPLAFGTTLDTIPAALPYLRADPAAIAERRAELDARPGLKVGLVWRGNPDHKRDRFRSIPLAVLRPLLQVPGVTFVSLQKKAPPDEVDLLGREAASVDAGPHLGDFAATAAQVAALDLVITVDTATCHLAGALGIPTWTLLEFAAEWRWMRNRTDSPWYPTMRLFRQPKPGDWDSVAAAAADALSRLPRLR